MDGIKPLLDGYKAYLTVDYRRDEALLRSLAEHGQSPRAMVISCCDSRVEPSAVLGTIPGDLFVVRNVANLIPPYLDDSRHHGTSAALEFAVTSLEVPHIIIMGHAMCGGIKALIEGSVDESGGSTFIANWMSIAREAKDSVVCSGHDHEKIQEEVEKAAILHSLKNLMTFPFIKQRVEAGKLQLHGWYFDFSSGELLGYDKNHDGFVNLTPSL
ncbi:carbonic anhydrase [Kiloniella laminariae]|uniref:carbonic anhydrase n=1 Tax=Kiloniella laminariae TaxID=454162 RepID=UPI00036F62C9|nr:carbonic anhydrase [Kiloniella laminariae]